MQKIIGDVLEKVLFERLKKHAIAARYEKLALDEETSLYYAWPPKNINDAINDKIKKKTGLDFIDIASFLRLNTGTLDTEFRIHNDAEISGIKPTHAAVFYLETSDVSGTALFKHPLHGKSSDEVKVFKSNDGFWQPYYNYFARENSLFLYSADLFHGRFPWKAYGKTKYDGRIVLVKFLKEKTR